LSINNGSEVPVPHPSRLDPERYDYQRILEIHEEACRKGESVYRDPSTGYSVFTAFYHLKRGTCCNRGCRHCPYIKG